MPSVTIDKRFCGPPDSANGGYACGVLAQAVGRSAEVTLRAPPPLGRPLELTQAADGTAELRDGARLLGTARNAGLDLSQIPVATFAEAEDAARRSRSDEGNRYFRSCFVCGPARRAGDGLRIFVGPLGARSTDVQVLAGPWVPYPDLAGNDGRVATEFVWAALDCPSGFACIAARRRKMHGTETILLGRMRAEIHECPRPGDRCVLTAWPTGGDGRKLFANSALIGAGGEILAVAQSTWVIVDGCIEPGQT
jgi:hypothetical protein